MKTAVVIPALDEEEAIGAVVKRVPRDVVHDVIVVDNGSTDRTAVMAERAGARVVREPRRGYGAACRAGVAAIAADTRAVVFLDGDGSQHPEEIPDVLRPLLAGRADLVLGRRRFARNHPRHAELGTRLVAAFIRRRWAVCISDVGPFRAISTDLLARLGMRDRGFGWPVEMVVKAAAAGARIAQVEVSHAERVGGRSKVSGTVLGSLRAGYAFLRVAFRAAREKPPA